MKINISKHDIIWNYIGTVFQMGINYLLLPFFLHYFDDDTLGLWYIFMNLSQIATLFIFGFSPTFARNLAYCWNGSKKLDKFGASDGAMANDGNLDYKLFGVVMSTCKFIYFLIAIGALLVLTVPGTVYVLHIAGYMFDNLNIWLAWAVFLFAIFFNIYYGYYISILGGIGKVAERNKAQVSASVIRILLTGILLAVGLDLLGACIAYMAYGILLRLICRRYFYSAVKEARIEKYTPHKQEIRECLEIIWPNSWRDGMVSVADYLCTQAGTIVASFFLSLSQTGVYSLSVQLVTAIAKISRSYQIAQIPSLQSAFIRNDREEAKKVNSMCITMYCMIYIIGMVMLILVGIPIVEFMKPGMNLSRLLIIMIGIVQFLIVLRNCYGSYLSTTNRVEYWKAFIFSGVLAILLSIAILYFSDIGVYGILIATIISEGIYNAWHWMLKVSRELNVGIGETLAVGVRGILKK